jgi:hypothetical protein
MLLALSVLLPDLKYPSKVFSGNAMQGHIVAHSRLIGQYQQF